MHKNKPRIHITVNSVRALSPSLPNKKTFDWDDEVRGFGCYRTSCGDVIFVYQYRMPYMPARRARIGQWGEMTPAQAREIAREWAVMRRKGVDPIEDRRKAAREEKAARDLVISTYVTEYLARREREGRPVAKLHGQIMVRDVAGLMPDMRLDRMTDDDVEKWLEQLQTRSKSAKRYGLIYLKVLLNDAKARGRIDKSPADRFKVPDQQERDRVLSPFEIQRVMEACRDMSDQHGDVLECLMRTMRRKEEVAAMPWEEIDPETWVWTIPAERTKTRTRYVMELPAQVIAILERQQPDPMKRTGWVFSFDGTLPICTSTQAKDTLDAHIQRRMELAFASGQKPRRFEQRNFHDFRTTAATHLGEEPLNVRDDIIELCLAHSRSKDESSKYQRAEKRSMVRAAFDKWNAFLDELMERPDAWPGGRDLPRVAKGELKRRRLELRAGWTKKVRPLRTGEVRGGRRNR